MRLVCADRRHVAQWVTRPVAPTSFRPALAGTPGGCKHERCRRRRRTRRHPRREAATTLAWSAKLSATPVGHTRSRRRAGLLSTRGHESGSRPVRAEAPARRQEHNATPGALGGGVILGACGPEAPRGEALREDRRRSCERSKNVARNPTWVSKLDQPAVFETLSARAPRLVARRGGLRACRCSIDPAARPDPLSPRRDRGRIRDPAGMPSSPIASPAPQASVASAASSAVSLPDPEAEAGKGVAGRKAGPASTTLSRLAVGRRAAARARPSVRWCVLGVDDGRASAVVLGAVECSVGGLEEFMCGACVLV
jgi:hypothetical protein